ncbi:hypothetical protein PIB30_071661 [Stylosanthes scabra]|uniref:Uncharacterized protein n=1 Tax=Stylosanthes scabra TaxID=79078 RepID=A0ABU6RNU9_9FABA|nr:hypothetical protein [Stylosanthes scabra]
MARKSVTHVIIILMIGLIICYYKVKFEKAIVVEGHCATFYDVAASKLGECIKECEIRHENDSEKKKKCILECINVECMRRYPADKTKRDACVDEIYNKYENRFNGKNITS